MLDTTCSRVDLYNKLAPIYDRLHSRFLRMAGGSAQGVLDGAVTVLLKPGMKVLDGGCGTGKLARRLLDHESDINISLLDAAPAMLRHSKNLRARRVHGSVSAIPFRSETFDLVLCTWVIETVEEPLQAIEELWRVTRNDGHFCLVFCANIPNGDIVDQLIARVVRFRRTGQFLNRHVIEAKIQQLEGAQWRRVPCEGPAAVYLIKKSNERSSGNDG